MADRYLEIAATEAVKQLQARWSSRSSYDRLEGGPDRHHQLGPDEIDFIKTQDSFFLSSINEHGWPYVQHRGGPPGFLKILDENKLGFPDFKGNRQYLSFGNLVSNPKVSLFLIDYPTRTRLKIFGYANLVEGDALPKALLEDQPANGASKIERGIVIQVEAFDWNCPKYIVPRYTEAQVRAAIEPLVRKIKDLETELASVTRSEPRHPAAD